MSRGRYSAAQVAAQMTLSEEQSEIEENLSDLEPQEREASLPAAVSSSDSSESEDEEPGIIAAVMTAPSGQRWRNEAPSSRGRQPVSNVMRQRPGLTRYAERKIDESVVTCFKLLFDQEMLDTILHETNRQGRRLKRDTWKAIASTELDAYIGLCILRGAYKSNNESVRELWNPETGRNIFGQTMSINRFEEIRSMLRFDNPATRASRQQRDKLAAVRLLIDGFLSNCQLCYEHNESVTVDEQLYPFKGRCFLVQYMPSKPSKYGLKFWVLADSVTYYISNFELYTGKDDSRTVALGEHVVMKMTSHIYGTGRNVTCDNFFTSLHLARELTKKRLTLVGTIRSHRREVPREMRSHRGRELYSSMFAYSTEDSVQLVSYKAKASKNVLVLSSQHKQPEISNGPKRKPSVILYYNATKSGVDCVDERISTYSTKYRSKRWHVAVFCNLLDMACYNAFVLYTQAFPQYNIRKTHRRRCFLLDLGMTLSAAQRERRTLPSQVLPLPSSSNEAPPKKGRCYLCPRTADRKSRAVCCSCSKNICSNHTVVKCSNCE